MKGLQIFVREGVVEEEESMRDEGIPVIHVNMSAQLHDKNPSISNPKPLFRSNSSTQGVRQNAQANWTAYTLITHGEAQFASELVNIWSALKSLKLLLGRMLLRHAICST